MYYFWVLNHLKENPTKQYSALELYQILSVQYDCNARVINRTLHKLFLKHPNIFREERFKQTNSPTGTQEYIYFFKAN